MNTNDQNHEPAHLDDLHDRLVDRALAEVVGKETPPDLSVRILTSNPIATPVRMSEAVSSNRFLRLRWIELVVAASVLVAIAALLLPATYSVRETARSAAKHNRLDSKSQSSTPGTVLGIEAQNHAMPSSNAEPVAPVDAMGNQWDTKEVIPKQETLVREGRPGVKAQGTVNGRTNLNTAGAPIQLDATSAPVAPIASEGDGNSFGYQAHQHRYSSEQSAESPPQPTASPPISPYFQMHDEEYYFARSRLKTDHLAGVTPRLLTEKEGSEPRLSILADNPTELGRGAGTSGDQYTRIVENPFIKVEGGAAVSTFSIDVDTASYANVRQFLMQMNQLPPPDAVRIEELINYFDYDYTGPTADAADSKENDANENPPFAAHVEVSGCPWTTEHRLVRIGIKGREMSRDKRPLSNLVFLVDVSGSMDEPNKLPLVVNGLEQLTRQLGENDRVAIVVYAGSEGLALSSTRGTEQKKILETLGRLKAGGSTAGGAGITLAYQIAEDNFIQGGTNRVILCTDGDFNVGVTSTAELERLVEKKAKETGVFLSVLGFGRGNLNDAMMETIADHGNGNYHYVDNRSEARRVLVEEMTGTLVTIAKDVKIQVEFNPAQVAGYRLIGYENRMLRTEDFNDDKKDAGEIGAGHTVTALYEIVPAGKEIAIPAVDDLKYQQPVPAKDEQTTDKNIRPTAGVSDELLTLKMRYKQPEGDVSRKLEWPVRDEKKAFGEATDDFQFAAAVAGFGLLLRDSQYKGNLTYAGTLELAQGGIGRDEHGYRAEFLDLIQRAKSLRGE